jgi:hypothetical protein
MGAGLPSAIAVAILYPEKKVVAVCGDGGFMMNSQACIYIYIHISLSFPLFEYHENWESLSTTPLASNWKSNSFYDFGMANMTHLWMWVFDCVCRKWRLQSVWISISQFLC